MNFKDESGKEYKSLDEILSADSEFQSQFDKKVSSAIDKRTAALKDEFSKELAEAKEAATKAAKMSADERKDFELKKMAEEKAKAEADLRTFKLKEDARKYATEKGLDVGYLDFIDFNTEDFNSVTNKIDKLADFSSKKVEAMVNEKLKEKNPNQKETDTTSEEKAYLDKKYANNKYYQK